MKCPRRNHAPGFKTKIAPAALQGDKTVVELAQAFDVHRNQITQVISRAFADLIHQHGIRLSLDG